MVRNDKTEANLGVSPGPLMSEREVALYLRVSTRTIIDWRQRGIIPFFRIGRSIRFSRDQIDRALLERHQYNAGALSA
jgi:excisionase family DNA binding protein